MARDDEDDLYDEEFDFVDDDDDDFEEGSEVETEPPAKERAADDRGPNNREKRVERDPRDDPDERDERDGDMEQAADEEPVDEYGRTAPKADYVVHIYEYEKFKRTIDRPFTPEDAEAFATEYNRTGKSYGRVAVTGKNDGKPKKTLD
jgi:hypothetical protein